MNFHEFQEIFMRGHATWLNECKFYSTDNEIGQMSINSLTKQRNGHY